MIAALRRAGQLHDSCAGTAIGAQIGPTPRLAVRDFGEAGIGQEVRHRGGGRGVTAEAGGLGGGGHAGGVAVGRDLPGVLERDVLDDPGFVGGDEVEQGLAKVRLFREPGEADQGLGELAVTAGLDFAIGDEGVVGDIEIMVEIFHFHLRVRHRAAVTEHDTAENPAGPVGVGFVQ